MEKSVPQDQMLEVEKFGSLRETSKYAQYHEASVKGVISHCIQTKFKTLYIVTEQRYRKQ